MTYRVYAGWRSGVAAALWLALLCGSAAASQAISARAVAAPTIIQQPASVTAAIGDNVAFTVVAAGVNLSYQWYRNGLALSGATNSTYALYAVTTAAAGNYRVTVRNTAGSANSATVTLTVMKDAAPTITTQPASLAVTVGDSATLSVTATGVGLYYQWYKSNRAIAGASAAAYTIDAVTTASAGSYCVMVKNSGGSVTSAAATLTVSAVTAPVITTQPVDVKVATGSSATFSVVASGSNLSYQWYKGGTAIADATSADYTIAVVATADVGSYSVRVQNTRGQVKSTTATLRIGSAVTAPTITRQPTAVVATINTSASLSVSVSGTGLSYQWYKNGAAITGATSATYTVSPVSLDAIGAYYVIVTNGAGSVTSSSAMLCVVNGYGIWAVYEQNGGTASGSSEQCSATAANESTVWVTNAGVLTMTNMTLATSGSSTSLSNSALYGLNAAVLNTSGTIAISGGAVTTTGAGAGGIVAVGSGATTTISGGTVKTSGNYAGGVAALQGGVIKCANTTISTTGVSAPALSTGAGGGTVSCTGGVLTTAGTESPGLLSTGAVTVSGATVKAAAAEAAALDGSSALLLSATTLSSGQQCGVLLYSSTGSAGSATGVFTMANGALTAAVGPLFYVTNTTGIIKVTGASLTAASGTLLSASSSRWGASGSNGGVARFLAAAETLTGNVVSDNLSAISLILTNSTTLTGAINSAALTLDGTSKWIVTAKSTLTTLTDTSGIAGAAITNIIGNGATVYYDKSLTGNSYLGGKTYSLVNGGYLRPQ